jgi:hypothetical protein
MINKKLALKVKVKHLAEEVRIIKREEYRSDDDDTRDWLHIHRIHGVRPECRASHIAYAFAKGMALKKIEKFPEEIPQTVWARVTKMVNLYSGKSTEEFTRWIDSSIA